MMTKRSSGAMSIALASIPLLLAIGITVYRVMDSGRPHNAWQVRKQKRAALIHQMTARLMRECGQINKRPIPEAEKQRERGVVVHSALWDFNRVEASGYTLPYPTSSH